MKRTLILGTLLLFSRFAFSQTMLFDSLLQCGKAEFHKEFDQQDYAHAVACLTQAVELQPDNAVAHYFLGYAYSRLNAADGNGMTGMNRSTTMKASEQFEIVNKLSPKYDGEIVVLDPWSKLTAEWGSMAFCYLYRYEKDSAMWAFNEGRKRGGFGDYFLAVARRMLDLCDKNSILVSSGDNLTIPLWYLQTVENYRTDVLVVDVSLINTLWYPHFISRQSKIHFTGKNQNLDSVTYCPWTDSLVSIKGKGRQTMSWIVKSSVYDGYLLRGDVLLLNLLVNNRFKREVFFTKGFYEKNQLSLTSRLQSFILCDRVNWNHHPTMDHDDFMELAASVTALLKFVNCNSVQEMLYVDNVRYELLVKAKAESDAGDTEHAREILKFMEDNIDIQKFPFGNESLYKYYENIKNELK